MDYLQYSKMRLLEVTILKVLNLIINGLPSILKYEIHNMQKKIKF